MKLVPQQLLAFGFALVGRAIRVVDMRSVAVAAALMFAHDTAVAQDIGALKAKYLGDPNTSEEIKTGIKNGVVVIGMCPFQAFAAAGLPGSYMVSADKKWGSDVPPPTIISAQCANPDDSTFALMFQNKTQFSSEKPVVFRAKFSRGKVVIIDTQSLID